MIKMKSVPIIFLIFMFIILTIPAYAADTKKITSVNIQRIYKAKEGEINPDQVSFKPGRSEYTITYQGMYDASDLPIGSYMDYKITLNAKKGYDFEWLKERNCLSDSGTIQGLSISEDYSSCSFTLHAYPLPMVLNQPQQLRWKGTDAEWDPVEHADSYHVTIYVEKNLHAAQPLSTPEKFYIQNQEIIFLKSKLPATKRTCIPVKKQSWLIIIQNIYLLKISAIIQDTGRRKMVRNSINLLPPNALNMIANTL